MTDIAAATGAPAQSIVDWTAYADDYDLLLDYNPAYQDLIARFQAFLNASDRPDPRVLDMGGGTGNFSAALLGTLPAARLTFLEPDPGMMQRAAAKLSRWGDVDFALSGIADYQHDQRFDLIVATHALYTLPDPSAALRKLRDMASPGARLFAIDFGAPMRVWSWRLYLGGVLLRQLGLSETLRLMRAGKGVAQQNARIAQAQREGRYWLHDTPKFIKTVEAAGWRVTKAETVYRGCSTLVVAEAA